MALLCKIARTKNLVELNFKMIYGVGLAVFVSIFVLFSACNAEVRRKRPKISPFEIKDELIGDLHTKVLSNSNTGIL